MNNYQGHITKYSLERELIWTTKNNESTRFSGTECVYSVVQYCGCNTEEHRNGNLRDCTCIETFLFETCSGSGSGGVSGTNNNGNEGEGNYSGGGNANPDDPCQTSGTNILDGQPIAGIGGDCAPNVETGMSSSGTATAASNLISLLPNLNLDQQNWINNPQNNATVELLLQYLLDNCGLNQDCEQLLEDVIISILEYQLNETIGDGDSFMFDNTLNTDNTLNLDSVELEEFFNNLVSNNFTNTSSEMEAGFIRRDIHSLEFSSFPQADIIASIKVQVPEPNNALECLEILHVRTNLEGNNTLFDWTQLDSENPNNLDGPLVEVDQFLDSIKIYIQGEVQIGLKIDGYPFRVRREITVLIAYNYSTGELNENISYWYYTH